MAGVLAVVPSLCLAASIRTQGTLIGSKEAVLLSDDCEVFTADNVGRRAMAMSWKEIEASAGGKLTPLVKAWFAYERIEQSPLEYPRKQAVHSIKYASIKSACAQLERDFFDDSKWVR
jgi:hypothetical protein